MIFAIIDLQLKRKGILEIMAQTTFEKTARNTNLTENSRIVKYNPKSTKSSWIYEIEPEATDRNTIRSFFGQELTFFNHLVTGFSSRLIGSPDTLDIFCEESMIELFGDLCGTKTDIRKLRSPDDLHKVMKRWSERLFEGSRMRLSETHKILFELACGPGALHPNTRKNMGMEFARHFRDQAAFATVIAGRTTDDSGRRIVTIQEDEEPSVYRKQLQVMEKADGRRKRHVQLPRIAVKVSWNEEKGESSISIPYAKSPITIPNIDLTSEEMWNHVIIRQVSDVPSSAWQIIFQRTPKQYLLTFSDSSKNEKSSIFNQAKYLDRTIL